MAGNPDNASLWVEADVYVNPDLDGAIPASVDEEFDPTWGLVGLLNGDDGFVTSRSEDKSDHFAWGGILVRTSRKNFKLTRKFSALEDNKVTRELIWPGSPAGKLIVPRPQPVLLGFETRESGKKHRLITARYAIVDLDGDVTENESDLTKYELLSTIYPTGEGELFIEQSSDDDTDDGDGGGDDGGSGE